ncbi:hypothetical protein EDF71_12236 [Comamonas sp. JUb58]|nr:hypothetical protein EDF71_12236 [Comamonas sp. JUb58]
MHLYPPPPSMCFAVVPLGRMRCRDSKAYAAFNL